MLFEQVRVLLVQQLQVTYSVGTVFLQMGRLMNKTRVNKSKEFESLNLTNKTTLSNSIKQRNYLKINHLGQKEKERQIAEDNGIV